MTNDQQFIIAIITIVVPTIASVVGIVQGRQTHNVVNGMQKRKVRQARAQGKAAGIAQIADISGARADAAQGTAKSSGEITHPF